MNTYYKYIQHVCHLPTYYISNIWGVYPSTYYLRGLPTICLLYEGIKLNTIYLLSGVHLHTLYLLYGGSSYLLYADYMGSLPTYYIPTIWSVYPPTISLLYGGSTYLPSIWGTKEDYNFMGAQRGNISTVYGCEGEHTFFVGSAKRVPITI